MTVPKTASDVLRDEHQVILRVLAVLMTLVDKYNKTGDFDAPAFQQAVEFFRLFADACHHCKEEKELFPVLESRGIPRDGGPIGVMLYEHQVGRGFVKEMAGALAALPKEQDVARQRFVKAARQYHDLLQNHIFKEDNVLFRMGDQVMSPKDQAALETRFQAVGCSTFEGKHCGDLRRIADELEARIAK